MNDLFVQWFVTLIVGIDLGFKKKFNASISGGILKFSLTSKTVFTNLDKKQVHVIKNQYELEVY